ncbi:376_t:CDS:2 [Entrophospora sp. SA101]|nr:376_t:CDS:2 [Entrophospora sp. SA101]CAJ0830190.1 19224_t:CDS:2 [Entrophospora sp. SA101]
MVREENEEDNDYDSNYSKYIDIEALFGEIKTSLRKGMIPLKPVDVFHLLKKIYEGESGNNSIQETRSYVPTILPKNATIPSTTTTSTTNANLTPIYPLTTQSTTQYYQRNFASSSSSNYLNNLMPHGIKRNYQDHYNQSSTTTTTNSLQMSNNSNNTSLNEEDQEDESESGESESDENEEEEGSAVEEEGWISPKQVLAPNGKYLIIKYDEVETEQSGSEKEVDDEDLSVLESDEGIHSGSRRWLNVELTILLKYIFRRINTRKLYHDLGLKKSS